MIKLVLFYSQSKPHDDGINLTVEKDKMIHQYKDEFDEIIVYTPSILKELGYNQSVKEYSNPGLVSANYKQNCIGFCAWKPLIIKLELLKSNKDDIIFYHDVNCTKYTEYLLFKDIKNTVNKIFEKCNYDFFFPQEPGQRLVTWCKTNVIEELGNNHNFNYYFHQVCVNCAIVKNTRVSLLLLDEWIECCNNEKWLNGEMYGKLSEHFIHHCPEQSILNNIIANWIRNNTNNISQKFPFIFFNNRNINLINDITEYSYLFYLN